MIKHSTTSPKDDSPKPKTRKLNLGTFMNVKTDFGFHKIFGYKFLLIAFLNALQLFKDLIIDIEYLPPEQFGHTENDRVAIYDIYVRTDSGKRIIIEMQIAKQHNFIKRLLFYFSYSIVNQALKGKIKKINSEGEEVEVAWDYDFEDVYVVAIADFEIFNEPEAKDTIIEHVQLMRTETNIKFTDSCHFVTIELTKFNKTIDELETLRDMWLYCLKNMEKLSKRPPSLVGVFKQLFEITLISKLKGEEMEAYKRSVLEYDDVIRAVNYAEDKGIEIGKMLGIKIGEKRGEKRGKKQGIELGEKRGVEIGKKQGIELGEKRGIELGEKRGIEIGKNQGIELGRLQSIEGMVRNCFKQNMSVKKIADLTACSVEEINEMLKKLKLI